jgi:peptide/nickel transport system ATP-binding protein
MSRIIDITDLSVEFDLTRGNDRRVLRAVESVTLGIERGEILGIIGESGSGKTTLASAVLNLVQRPGKVTSGSIVYLGRDALEKPVDLRTMSSQALDAYRWTRISCVFQAAQNALNPILKLKDVFIETVLAHEPRRQKDEIIARAKLLLDSVRLNDYVLEYYPYQLSGGMKQRVLIALSLLLEPDIIILDEPTTALDVITQKYIMTILKEIHDAKGVTMVFLTHDIAIIGSLVDRMAVMYAGRIVEIGSKKDLFQHPKHPYTFGLLHAIPTLTDDLSNRRAIPGMPPDLLKLPPGCSFRTRCFLADSGSCTGEAHECSRMVDYGNGQMARCEHGGEVRES